MKEIFIIIVQGTLSISLNSLRIPFGIEFGPTALQALISLIISEMSSSVTGFHSNKINV